MAARRTSGCVGNIDGGQSLVGGNEIMQRLVLRRIYLVLGRTRMQVFPQVVPSSMSKIPYNPHFGRWYSVHCDPEQDIIHPPLEMFTRFIWDSRVHISHVDYKVTNMY